MKNSIDALREIMAEYAVNAYIVPNNDEFQNEYLPDSAKRLEFVTGFTGSAGTAIIAHKKAAFFTDGRYTIQAAAQVDSAIFEIYNLAEKTPQQWLKENELKASYDPWHMSVAVARRFNGIGIYTNLVDEIWKNRPAAPLAPIKVHDIKYAGKKHTDKIAEIASGMAADIALITAPDCVSWLFNIRGGDIEYSPLALSYAAICKNGKAELFIDRRKLTPESESHLTGINIRPLEEVIEITAKSVQLDADLCPNAIFEKLQEKGIEITEKQDPCLLPKACKNDAELDAIRKAHDIDGVALTKFLQWLPNQNGLDEISAAAKLEEFRKENPEYIEPSFATISGFGSNGAIVHYHASAKTNKKFEQGLYLVDSGGQYCSGEACGTTDVTRTIAIGTPTAEMKHDYTLVLKGHIALAMAVFPAGTSGAQLDVLARKFLWQEGKDYAHGTGHGVGAYLSVHEGPCGVSKRYDTVLQAGMILSNEPGYYKEGEYGIRIENLVVVVEKESESVGEPAMSPRSGVPNEVQKNRRGTIKYLGFETLTKAPFDENLIEWEILTDEEKGWIKDYHEQISRNI